MKTAVNGDASLQGGMVLVLCLIFLTALAMLGMSAASDTILQNKLSANLQETERARQSALATLHWTEKWLLELEGPAPETCISPCDGLRLHSSGDLPRNPENETFEWWMAQGHEAGIDPVSGERITTFGVANINPPVWIIEAAHTVPPEQNSTGQLLVWYRILARGSSETKNVISVMESTLVRSWPSSVSSDMSADEGSETCSGAGEAGTCGRVSWRELR